LERAPRGRLGHDSTNEPVDWTTRDRQNARRAIVIDVASLLEIAAYTTLVVAPAILLNRLVDGGDGPTLPDILRIPSDSPWPRGVQEEEPLPWRLELLDRRPAPDASTVACRSPRIARASTASTGLR
jgi:hypothetical protein